MDFTRDPIVETIITPKEGFTLVVRSSKSTGQEEYFVDAVEVVIFGHAVFFRSREKPKAFLVPATDYEILEVREARLVLKNVGLDRSIKIAGGREASLRSGKESKAQEKALQAAPQTGEETSPETAEPALKAPARSDKKRDRRRNYRKGKNKDEEQKAEATPSESSVLEEEPFEPSLFKEEVSEGVPVAAVLSTLLPPPTTLISETIARYKDNALFKGAFFMKGEEEVDGDEITTQASESLLEAFKEPLTPEGEFSPLEEISVARMSLDYPIYGEGIGIVPPVHESALPFSASAEEPSEQEGKKHIEESKENHTLDPL